MKCSYEFCGKEINNPILVSNFSFTPKKETYYACPYCLTKIENMAKTCSCTSNTTNQPNVDETKKKDVTSMKPPENSKMNQRFSDLSIIPQKSNQKKIENLKKEKQDLLTKLAELKNGAIKKINGLEEDVRALRQEAEILKKLTDR